MAMISINSIYNFDPRIFDKFNVPTGMKKADVIDNICYECAELSLIYTDPAFLKNAIGLWSRKEQKVWEKLFATENFDYNPIWNVDGTVVEHEVNNRDKSGNINRTTSDHESMNDVINEKTETEDVRSGDAESSTINSVTGYNNANWQAHEKEAVEQDHNDRANIDTDRELRENRQTDGNGSENVSDTENVNGARNLETRRTGNIGVTTTQKMIREERDVVQFNTIDYITQSFKKRFCVMVY